MKPATAILVSGLTAVLISAITAVSVARASSPLAPAPVSESLRPQIEQLRAELQALRARMDAVPAPPAATAAARPEAAPRPAAATTAPATVGGPSLDQIRIAFKQGRASEAMEKLFEAARKANASESLIRSFQTLVEENPQDASAHCLLARAFIEALMAEPNFIQKGEWARKADVEYLEAIRIDPSSWDAHYSRAFSLSWWPEQLGMLPEAIRSFERALELQAGSAAQPRYADTYAQLGRLYARAAKTEKAVTVLSEGLRVFPGNEELKKQLDLIQGR
ncbi:MAG TPA: tetratricopeptide repeat protein [Planctomycetota bacterium]|jgi:tetratricopeptide (TPR) repeat protein|nr:tetratricopeptide repeat protein [Planctomycetota bacterium]